MMQGPSDLGRRGWTRRPLRWGDQQSFTYAAGVPIPAGGPSVGAVGGGFATRELIRVEGSDQRAQVWSIMGVVHGAGAVDGGGTGLGLDWSWILRIGIGSISTVIPFRVTVTDARGNPTPFQFAMCPAQWITAQLFVSGTPVAAGSITAVSWAAPYDGRIPDADVPQMEPAEGYTEGDGLVEGEEPEEW